MSDLTIEGRTQGDPLRKLRWGVFADGVLIIACVLRERAEMLAAKGRRHTPREHHIEVRDLHAE